MITAIIIALAIYVLASVWYTIETFGWRERKLPWYDDILTFPVYLVAITIFGPINLYNKVFKPRRP